MHYSRGMVGTATRAFPISQHWWQVYRLSPIIQASHRASSWGGGRVRLRHANGLRPRTNLPNSTQSKVAKAPQRGNKQLGPHYLRGKTRAASHISTCFDCCKSNHFLIFISLQKKKGTRCGLVIWKYKPFLFWSVPAPLYMFIEFFTCQQLLAVLQSLV